MPTKRSVTSAPPFLHTFGMARDNKSDRDLIAALSGRRIAAARKLRQWSQGELAEATGWTEAKPSQAQRNALSPSRIANFEQGTRRVGIEEAAILSRVLGYPPPYWMGVVSEQEAAIIETLRKSA